MNFADDFSKTFCDKEEFLEFWMGLSAGQNGRNIQPILFL